MRVWLALALLAVILAVTVEAKKNKKRGSGSKSDKSSKSKSSKSSGSSSESVECDFAEDEYDDSKSWDKYRGLKGGKGRKSLGRLCKPLSGPKAEEHCSVAAQAIEKAQENAVSRASFEEYLQGKVEALCEQPEPVSIEQLQAAVDAANETLANRTAFWADVLPPLEQASIQVDLVWFTVRLQNHTGDYVWQLIPGRDECVAAAGEDEAAIDACFAFFYEESEQFLREFNAFPDFVVELVLAPRRAYLSNLTFSEMELGDLETELQEAVDALEAAQEGPDPCAEKREKHKQRLCKKISKRYERFVARSQDYDSLLQSATDCYNESCPSSSA